MKKFITLSLFITCLILILSSPSTFSQTTGVLVYPTIIELNFSGTDKTFASASIVAENTTNNSVRIRAYVQSWDLDEYGVMRFKDLPDERSLNNYIKFNPLEFELGPKQKQLVRVTAKLPEGSDGEFKSVIFLESVNPKEQIIKPDNKNLSVMVKFITRYGITLYAYKGLTSRNAVIDNVNYEIIDNKPNLVLTLSNQGNIHTYVEGKLSLLSTNKNIEKDIIRYAVMPNRTQKDKILLPTEEMKPGDYTAKIKLTYKDITGEDKVLEAEKTFNYDGKKVTSVKNQLEKPEIDEDIKMTPDNVAKPINIDESEIKLTPAPKAN